MPTRVRAAAHLAAMFLLAAAIAAVASLLLAISATARPSNDPFYRYAGTTPVAELAPGAVLAQRSVPYHLAGIPTPLRAIQLLYRSTDHQGQPTVNVTSVVRPPGPANGRLLAFQSAYDSLDPADEPSAAIAGDVTFGGLLSHGENLLLVPLLLQGYTLTITDTQGQNAAFAGGPDYGRYTLDALRATLATPAVGLRESTRIGLLGYSGGAIGTEWAAELAPSYAPDVDRRIVGAAMGGVLVHPAHNLRYVDGSKLWGGVIPMAVIGIGRSMGIDLNPYLNAKGRRITRDIQRSSIIEVLPVYPNLTWAELALPQYRDPERVPVYVAAVNQLIMGERHTPSVPLFIGQGTRGEGEGTRGDRPGIGRGDGVMIAGDVRTLARRYCDRGLAVLHREYGTSHIPGFFMWYPQAIAWLGRRFGAAPAPSNCAQIAPGNPIAPIGVEAG